MIMISFQTLADCSNIAQDGDGSQQEEQVEYD